MNTILLFFASETDPNGMSQIRGVIQQVLANTNETGRVLIISEGNRHLIQDLPKEFSHRLLLDCGGYKNFNEAVLAVKEKGLLECDLLLLTTPGDIIEINQQTLDTLCDYYRLTEAGFIISDHYEYLGEYPKIQPMLQKLKPGHDPSNIIIPGRSNHPALFCHGSLIAVGLKYINSRVFDPDVDYGSDYAIRMGVQAQNGTICTIPKPIYRFQRGKAYYPGEGVQQKFEEKDTGSIGRHFSYTKDPARFEWGPISFQKYLKDIGAFLPDSFFNRKVRTDDSLGAGISFVLPTYNRAHLIRYAIESVIEVRKIVDRNIPIELIIVDNGHDQTPEVVQPYLVNHPKLIKYFKVSGLTLGGARNYGVYKSANRIIGQLDSDDVLIGDPVTKILDQFKRTGAAAIIGIYQTASRNSDTGALTLDNQVIMHDEYLCNQNNPLLQVCIPGPGAPRYYRKEAVINAGGYPDLLYGEDAALSDQLLIQRYIIERNLDEANYIAVRHSANTDSEELDTDLLVRKNFAKYSFKLSILEELKHLVLSNPDFHKFNNRVGF